MGLTAVRLDKGSKMGAGDASCGGDGDGGVGNGGGGGQPWNAAAALMNLIHITGDSQRGSRRSSCAARTERAKARQVDGFLQVDAQSDA